ncbi:hypothetical protein BH11ACT6_BH11ACT6_54520 [soil metagenome]
MAESLGLTPADLRATADHLADVSSRMKQVLASLNPTLDGEGPAWGDDKPGKEFADGADGGTGYLGQRDWVDGSVEAKTSLLDGYADGLRTAADTLEQTDQV